MRRAFSLLKMGRGGPVLVEIPNDVAVEEIKESELQYAPIKRAAAGANGRDVADAARALVHAKSPLILAGQGVLYAEASAELVELAELLQAPVTTPLEGKSAFPETHALALGTAAGVLPLPAHEFLKKADVIFAIGASLTKQSIVAAPIPPGKTIIHATNDERDINKHYAADYPLLGDAKAVLRQFIDAVKDLLAQSVNNTLPPQRIQRLRSWLAQWPPKPRRRTLINFYRIFFMRTFDAMNIIVTRCRQSAQSARAVLSAPVPRSYIGWGKSPRWVPGWD
jgi:acetolactate synthase-1/2/3 large subunit